LSFGKELSFSNNIVRKDGEGRLTLKIDLPQFEMSIRALLDTGTTTSTLGSAFTDKVKVGREESARQFDGSTMKLFTVDKALEIHLGDFYQETAFKLASESPYAMVLGMEWISKNIKTISMENWRIEMESGRFEKLTSSQKKNFCISQSI
jgi:hypothetical protein